HQKGFSKKIPRGRSARRAEIRPGKENKSERSEPVTIFVRKPEIRPYKDTNNNNSAEKTPRNPF
ncbi:hypothetical protein LJB87_01160, partial [Alistipes sp. OttesenSCG-928-L06]|nr:hypothetical protein [Alistipes sp. OttesenSCG-928-L06]